MSAKVTFETNGHTINVDENGIEIDGLTTITFDGENAFTVFRNGIPGDLVFVESEEDRAGMKIHTLGSLKLREYRRSE
jgi:hypothetical protein